MAVFSYLVAMPQKPLSELFLTLCCCMVKDENDLRHVGDAVGAAAGFPQEPPAPKRYADGSAGVLIYLVQGPRQGAGWPFSPSVEDEPTYLSNAQVRRATRCGEKLPELPGSSLRLCYFRGGTAWLS